MSVKSVLTGLPPSYSLLSGNTSQAAKSAAFAKQVREKTFAETDFSRVTSADDSVTQNASVERHDPADPSPLQSDLEQALREGGAAAGRPTSGASGPPGGQSSPGIALYQRISQYGSDEPSTSTLLKSWNSVMQGGPGAASAAAAFAQALSRNEALGSAPGVLDLTA